MRSPVVAAGQKPIDVGDGRLVVSFAASRPALLSVTSFHPDHGVAELSAVPAFDDGARGNPQAVRRYRTLLASDDFPCLWLEEELAATSRAWTEAGSIVFSWRIAGVEGRRTQLRFSGRIDRPALAEITDLDPPAPTGATTTLSAEGPRLVISSSLPSALAIECNAGEWRIDSDGAWLELRGSGDLIVRITAVSDLPHGRDRSIGPPSYELSVAAGLAPIVERALAYTRGCAALNTAPDEVAILADHRLLPLSWTRDAYYQALLLLATGMTADIDLVADHLRWLWRRCERPHGRWLRSHHANGRPKDLAFQADQQIYPMIELADYWRVVGGLPLGVDWTTEVGRAWAATIAEIDPRTGLIATAENAADDAVAAPFVAASQILLWAIALRLAELADARGLPMDGDALRATAATTRRAFERYLVADGRWLYATDAQSTHVRYHDANDLPVALAPLLGFCSPDDPAWRATMEFAFSRANPGYFPGERSGLGSAHTPAPWALGDIQAWIIARATGDELSIAAAAERLREVAYHDGMLPEAYSATRDPDVRIRHWFGWPGAVIGALLLLDARAELGRLRAG